MERSPLKTQMRRMIVSLLVFCIILGVIYPGIVMFINQLLFPHLSNGSLLVEDKLMGSALIGQSFTQPDLFWSRPTATIPAYIGVQSTGSNLSPANPQLMLNIQSRVDALKKADPTNNLPIPIDLVTASGSGLDPHISIAAAYYQVNRIAKARHLDEALIYDMVNTSIEYRQWGFLGEPRVNVVKLNLTLHKAGRK